MKNSEPIEINSLSLMIVIIAVYICTKRPLYDRSMSDVGPLIPVAHTSLSKVDIDIYLNALTFFVKIMETKGFFFHLKSSQMS